MDFTDAPVREESVLFGTTSPLVGIVTDPPKAPRGNQLPAVVILNCGLLHRVGPSRLYVKMARRLAAMGFVSLRFDFSGIGDSQVCVRHVPNERSAVSETQEAMDWLSAARGIGHFILVGLCAGGAKSFSVACYDSRVVGAALINVPFGADIECIESRVRAHFYWKRALFDPHNWLKVIKGKANYRGMMRALGYQLRKALPHKKRPPEDNKFMAGMRSSMQRGLNLLLVYSEDDYSLDYFRAAFPGGLNELRSSGKLKEETISQADHSFTSLLSQELILTTVCDWAGATTQELITPMRAEAPA